MIPEEERPSLKDTHNSMYNLFLLLPDIKISVEKKRQNIINKLQPVVYNYGTPIVGAVP